MSTRTAEQSEFFLASYERILPCIPAKLVKYHGQFFLSQSILILTHHVRTRVRRLDKGHQEGTHIGAARSKTGLGDDTDAQTAKLLGD